MLALAGIRDSKATTETANLTGTRLQNLMLPPPPPLLLLLLLLLLREIAWSYRACKVHVKGQERARFS